jgi:hypothetical protein
MSIFDTREELLGLAKQYHLIQTPREEQSEQQLMQLENTVTTRSPPHITRCELIKLASWKWRGGRTRRLCAANTEQEVEAISAASFAQPYEWLRVVCLTALIGVDWPMASVVLHFSYLTQREGYPILDVNALTAVCHPHPAPSSYNLRLWTRYTKLCRTIAQNLNVDLRTLDKALWVKGTVHKHLASCLSRRGT